MDRRSASSQVAPPTRKPGQDETRLYGHWLVLARGGWAVVVILALLVVFAGFVAPQAFCGRVSCSVVGYSGSGRLAYGFTLVVLPAVIWVMCGGVLFLLKSDDWLIWLFSLMFVIVGVCTLTDNLIFDISHQEIQGPLIWQFAPRFLYLLKSVLLLLAFALFPNGRFVPGWTRWVPFIYPAYTLLYLVLPAMHLPGWTIFNNPVDAILWFGSEGCLVVMQLYRYARRSGPVERQQIKWILFSFVVVLIADLLVSSMQNFLSVPLLYAYGGVFNYIVLIAPFFLAVALIRYRLWDIDILINRTLVYGTLTLILTAVYVGLVIGLQALLRGIISQDNGVAIVISTLAIAALFQPLRYRLQRVIDRRFYRSKYDAAKIVAAFSATLRQEVDLDQLRADLVAVVEETMQPTFVSLWLRPTQQDGERSAWGAHALSPRRTEESVHE